MTGSAAALALALALLPQQRPGPDVAPGAIGGRVQGQTGDEVRPLPHALVELTVGGRRLQAATDEEGRYRFDSVPPRAAVVTARSAGYEDFEVIVRVTPGGSLTLDLTLEGHPVFMGRIEVDGAAEIAAVDPADRPATRGRVEIEALRAGSGMAEAGLLEPGGATRGQPPTDPRDVLFMRGSTADLKLVLLDGAPVYAPFHLAGLLDPFEPASLSGAKLYLGAAPARFDGGVSQILSLETRRAGADRLHAEGSADLLGARLVVEGPLGSRAGLLGSGRVLHGLGEGLLASGTQPYGYHDGLARFDLDAGRIGEFRLTGFLNREAVHLDPGSALDSGGLQPADAWWANRLVSLRHQRALAGGTLTTLATRSRYEARLPVTDSSGAARIDGSAARMRVATEYRRVRGSRSLALGASLDRTEAGQSVTDATGVSQGRRTGRSLGLYGEAGLPLGEVLIQAGLRAERFVDVGRTTLAPRLGVTWPLSEEAIFRISTGRYHQLVRRADRTVDGGTGPRVDGASDELLSLASSTHLLVGIDQSFGDETTLGIEGFTKVFEGLPEMDANRLNASGLDLRIARSGSRVRGWLGYTLTWFWADGAPEGNGTFSGHHLLSGGLQGEVAGRWTADLRVSYGSGIPFTAVELPSTALDQEGSESPGFPDDGLSGGGATPSETFIRVNGTLSAAWRTRIAGREARIEPYLTLINALDRRDALFYYFDAWRGDETRPLAELSVVPLLGVRWRF